jgi:hypothetical protein
MVCIVIHQLSHEQEVTTHEILTSIQIRSWERQEDTLRTGFQQNLTRSRLTRWRLNTVTFPKKPLVLLSTYFIKTLGSRLMSEHSVSWSYHESRGPEISNNRQIDRDGQPVQAGQSQFFLSELTRRRTDTGTVFQTLISTSRYWRRTSSRTE